MKLRPIVLCAALFLGACARTVGPHLSDSLVGLSVPLLPSATVRMAVAGVLGARFAEVEFDVSTSITLVTTGCFEAAEVTGGQVKVVDPVGDEATLPLVRLEALRIGATRLKPFAAALIAGKRCVVTLGLDQLAFTALEVKVATRVLTVLPSRVKREWLAERKQRRVFEVTRDPKHDWPLVAVRVQQGPEQLTTTFVLSTKDRFSRVFESAAGKQGLRPGGQVLKQLFPNGGLAPELEAYAGVPYERFELAPGFGIGAGTLEVISGQPRHGISGVLAADIWGRFDVIYDVQSGVLSLEQPLWQRVGARHLCSDGDELSEPLCFELHAEKTVAGVNTVTTSWRPLEQGGRLYFDVVSPVPVPCRIGVTFSMGDRGRSAQHLYPWSKLAQAMPACSGALAQATEVKLGLFEEGPLAECPGVCAFVQDLRTGRTSCECQPTSGGSGSEVERRFFELYHQLLGPESAPGELEPADPDEGPV